MRLQNVFHRVAGSAVATGVWSDPMGFGFDLWTRVLNRNRQAAFTHSGQVNYVVANEGRLGSADPIFFQNVRKY